MQTLYPHLQTSMSFVQVLRSDTLLPPPALDKNTDNYVLAGGVFDPAMDLGPYAGKAYEIVLVHPDNVKTAFALSEIEFEKEQRDGSENIVRRTQAKIQDMQYLNMENPGHERGGLLVGLTSQNTLLAMGGVALLADANDGNRGQSFDLCAYNKQVWLKMGITHPAYAGKGLNSLIFPHRIHVATNMASALDREYLVTKAAGISTIGFYQNKLGMVQNGDPLFLPKAKAPDNQLVTLGQNIADTTQWLEQHHPKIAATPFDIYNLSDAYKTMHYAA